MPSVSRSVASREVTTNPFHSAFSLLPQILPAASSNALRECWTGLTVSLIPRRSASSRTVFCNGDSPAHNNVVDSDSA
jgi:hypothetical protein